VQILLVEVGDRLGVVDRQFLVRDVVDPRTHHLTNQLPAVWQTRGSYIRVFLIGLLLQVVLQRFARGLLPEKPPKPVEGDPLLAGRRSPGDGENVG